jgi:hypothetical protein
MVTHKHTHTFINSLTYSRTMIAHNLIANYYKSFNNLNTHTHKYTHIHLYIYS